MKKTIVRPILAIIVCIIFIAFLNFSTQYEKEQAMREAQMAAYNAQKFTITFDTDGGTPINPMIVTPNTYLPELTAFKDGYDFTGWTLNGQAFNFSGYVNSRITEDITLKANFTQKQVASVASDTTIPKTQHDILPSTAKEPPTSVATPPPSTYSPETGTTDISTILAELPSYQKIYDEYSQKLIEAGPTSSISEMADILTEGGIKMAKFMYSSKGVDGQYQTYEKWFDKLFDVYLRECR